MKAVVFLILNVMLLPHISQAGPAAGKSWAEEDRLNDLKRSNPQAFCAEISIARRSSVKETAEHCARITTPKTAEALHHLNRMNITIGAPISEVVSSAILLERGTSLTCAEKMSSAYRSRRSEQRAPYSLRQATAFCAAIEGDALSASLVSGIRQGRPIEELQGIIEMEKKLKAPSQTNSESLKLPTPVACSTASLDFVSFKDQLRSAYDVARGEHKVAIGKAYRALVSIAPNAGDAPAAEEAGVKPR